MKRLLVVALLVLAGCEKEQVKDPPEPAPIKTTSTLSISIHEGGDSSFSLSMRSNARSSAEAIQKAIRHLQDSLEGKVQAEAEEKKP